MSRRLSRAAGFILLPVILAMTLIAAIAFSLNRDNGVNAEMVAGQSDMDRARYAAEAGLQVVNASIQGNNCAGFYPSNLTPKTNSNFGGASYSAYAVVPWGNTTSLSATGSFNGATVTLTRNNVIAYRSTPRTYTLQPNATAGLDTYIHTGSTSNNGWADKLKLKALNSYPLFKFDLSMFPAGSLPLSATLSLYARGVGSGGNAGDKVSLYRLSSSWTETGVNWPTRDGGTPWAMPGGDFSPVAAASVPNIFDNTWANFDVTDLTTAWLLGRYPNNGFILASGPAAANAEFASSDGTLANAPKMSFTYLLPCGMTGP